MTTALIAVIALGSYLAALVLFLHWYRDDAEVLVLAGDDLLAGLDHLRVGRLSEIVPVGRVKPVPEHVSSDPGPDGAASVSTGQA
jgi:hypothetical protein